MKTCLKAFIALATVSIAACTSVDKNKFTIEATLSVHPNTAVELSRWDSTGLVPFDTLTTNASGKLETSFAVSNPTYYMLKVVGQDSILLAGENGTLAKVNLGTEGFTAEDKTLNTFASFYTAISDKEAEITSLAATYNPSMPAAAVEELIANYELLVADYYEAAQTYLSIDTTSNYQAFAALKLNPETGLEQVKAVKSNLPTTWSTSPIQVALGDLIVSGEKAIAQKKAQEEHEAARDEIIGIGKEAPEIALQNPKGRTLKLSSLRGNVVLIDFWASWCKPCRMENPNVVKVYKKYHKKGFEIFGVSLDKNKTPWVNAIKQDGLPWKHVSDLQGWQSVASQLYMVNSIPFTVLLDKEGKVIATNLRGAELEQKLAEIFGA